MKRESIVAFYNNTACVLVQEQNPILYISLRKWSKFSFEPASKDIFNEAEDLCFDQSTLVYQGWRPDIEEWCKVAVKEMFYKHAGKCIDVSDLNWLGFEFRDYDMAYAAAPHLVDHILENDYQPKWVSDATENN